MRSNDRSRQRGVKLLFVSLAIRLVIVDLASQSALISQALFPSKGSRIKVPRWLGEESRVRVEGFAAVAESIGDRLCIQRLHFFKPLLSRLIPGIEHMTTGKVF